ncbi:MAG TPA: hypothetical protein VJN19_08015 [Propionibacteriaceae bacterium]|nr:hypothetical protein [Propionibacteriaceae bacterium]
MTLGREPPLEVLVGESPGAGYDRLRSWISNQSNIRLSVRRPGLLTADEGS